MACVRQRINGNNMTNFINQDVIILGQIMNVEPSGRGLKVKCCDDQIIMCQLKQVVQEPIDPGTYIEVEGKVASRNLVHCDHFFTIDPTLTQNFDRKLYVDAINVLLTVGRKNNYVIEDVAEHHGTGDTVELLTSENENKADMDFQDASFINL